MCLAPLSVAAGLLIFRSVAAAFVLFHGGVCLLVPLTDMAVHKTPLRVFLWELGLHGSWRGAVSAILAGLFSFAAVFLFFSMSQGDIWDHEEISLAIDSWGINRMNPVFFVVMMVAGNGFLEEFFWRGYILRRLSAVSGEWTVTLLSSVFYASYHSITTGVLFSLPYAAASTASIFIAGIMWAWMKQRSGSLLFPVVTHVFVDLAIMVVYLKYLA